MRASGAGATGDAGAAPSCILAHWGTPQKGCAGAVFSILYDWSSVVLPVSIGNIVFW